MPAEPEPLGLLALMLFCESRAAARRSAGGDYVPLDAQDIARWNLPLRDRGRSSAAARRAPCGAVGPYQIEAAIQSAHAQRRLGAQVPAEALVALYDGLLALRPSIGAQVSRACAVAEARGRGRGPARARCAGRRRGRELPALLGRARPPAGPRRPGCRGARWPMRARPA